MKKFLVVVGTRPNFVKITQFKKVAKRYKDLDVKILHTGQHYDNNMSNNLINQFNLEIDYFLNVKSSSPAELIGEIIIKLEKVISEIKPDIVFCVGDVNSTLATAITTNKMGVKLAHVESGLRSNDREMPEEINRILTDEISDLCFVTEKSGFENLIKLGKNESEVFFVGNTMIDTLVAFEENIEKSTILKDISIGKDEYFLVTLHRPRNVDTKSALSKIISLISALVNHKKVVFPIHPRTKQSFEQFNLLSDLYNLKGLIIIDAQDYFSFQKLIKYSFCVITDSGGIQEETTFQRIPCITLRNNTERPSTIEVGTNILMDFNYSKILDVVNSIESGNYKKGKIPLKWDGKSTERIIEASYQNLS